MLPLLCIERVCLSLIYVERRIKLPWSGCTKLSWSVMHCLFRARSNEVQTVSTLRSRHTIYHEYTPRGDSLLSRWIRYLICWITKLCFSFCFFLPAPAVRCYRHWIYKMTWSIGKVFKSLSYKYSFNCEWLMHNMVTWNCLCLRQIFSFFSIHTYFLCLFYVHICGTWSQNVSPCRGGNLPPDLWQTWHCQGKAPPPAKNLLHQLLNKTAFVFQDVVVWA